VGDSLSAAVQGVSRRHRQLAPIAVVVAICVVNAVTTWFFPEPANEWIEPIFIGAWAMEPMLFAAWLALGPRFFVKRLPIVLATFVFLVAAPGLYRPSFAHVERYEFVVLFVVAMIVLAFATGMLLAVRRLAGLRIEHDQAPRYALGLQFNIRYLFILMTLCAMAIATLCGLTFGKNRPQWISFGPEFYVRIMVYVSVYCFFAVLPILAMGFVVLRPRRSWRAARHILIGWVTITLILIGVWILLMSEWSLEAPGVVAIQFGAAVTVIPAALFLCAAGYRLWQQTDAVVAS
jgi:hypothetical protein